MASIFIQILDGKIPGHFVWEDEHCFSIMTIQPIREGHLLVIPKLEVNHWDEVPADIAAHLMKVSQLIAKAIKAVVNCARVGVSIIGLEVPHTHIHLIPIDTMSDMSFAGAHDVPSEHLAEMASIIKANLIGTGHAEANIRKR